MSKALKSLFKKLGNAAYDTSVNVSVTYLMLFFEMRIAVILGAIIGIALPVAIHEGLITTAQVDRFLTNAILLVPVVIFAGSLLVIAFVTLILVPWMLYRQNHPAPAWSKVNLLDIIEKGRK